jgi:hypothetical protein
MDLIGKLGRVYQGDEMLRLLLVALQRHPALFELPFFSFGIVPDTPRWLVNYIVVLLI